MSVTRHKSLNMIVMSTDRPRLLVFKYTWYSVILRSLVPAAAYRSGSREEIVKFENELLEFPEW
jgi:hypothetical protein